MTLRSWIPTRPWGWITGVVVTACVAVAYVAGGFDRVSLACLDLAFRHLNRVEADDRIVMIDIGDSAIEQIGRWPWPRRRYAELIDTLADAGAAAIVVDVVFAEPQKPRLEHPALSADSDVDPPQVVLGEITPDDAIHDDDELTEAVRRAGNVYLAMFCKLASPDRPPERTETAARGLFGHNLDADLNAFRRSVGVDPSFPVEDQYEFWRIACALEQDFSLDKAALAVRLNLPGQRVERRLATIKDRVARWQATSYLAEHPEATFRELSQHVLPGMPADERSRDRAALLRAFRFARAMESMLADAPPTPALLRDRIPHGWDVAPPLDKLAAAAKRVAFITFEPDPVDGVFRHVPFVVDVRGRTIPHLGFAAAWDLFDVNERSLSLADGFLTVADHLDERHWRIPLNSDGQSLITWHVDRQRPRQWTESLVHVPAGRVMEVPLCRQAIEDNTAVVVLTLSRAVALRFGDDQAGLAEYASLVRRRNPLRRSAGRRRATATGSAEKPAESVEDLNERIRAIETQTRDWIAYMAQTVEGVEPESDEEKTQFAQYRDLHEKLVAGSLVEDVNRKNGRLEERITQRRAELRETINGKVCFVGYTATAVADTVNSPVFENMPGVLAHANVFNMVTRSRFPRIASRNVGVVLILLCGLVTTVLTSSRGPWVSLIGVLLVMAAVVGPGIALFMVGDLYVDAAVVAVGGVFIAWAFITLYRQVVEQKQRRLVSRSLARQTSPAIAAQLARGRTEADFAPQPAEVTCYFSDLQGFTTLSEAVGPERTKEVLNRYLGAMSEVLLEHLGSSKFMGDGIFAYFNAPIWTCADHAVAGCEAALECLAALAHLKHAEAGGEFGAEFESLVMRAGLHTGPVFAGIYGSGDRVEYTCIGDTVNLAARLEPANKVFGTRILVSESCRTLVGDRYVFRDLGKLQVKGKTRAVGVAELLGRLGQVDANTVNYAESFAEAVERFRQRDWDSAARTLQRCRVLRPDDAAVALYEAEIRALRENPPLDNWNQGIEMTAK